MTYAGTPKYDELHEALDTPAVQWWVRELTARADALARHVIVGTSDDKHSIDYHRGRHAGLLEAAELIRNAMKAKVDRAAILKRQETTNA